MITRKYNKFRLAVKKHLKSFKKGVKITEEKFDKFINKILTDKSFDIDGKIYCRDGFAFVNKIDKELFQVVAFQINSFGAGIFDKSIKRLCTPILLTVRLRGKYRYTNSDLKDIWVSIEEFYLGKYFSGSKGPLCKREKFNKLAQEVFIDPKKLHFSLQDLVYRLMTTNYLCHHIAETTSYAFGALYLYWKMDKEMCFLSSASSFNNTKSTLYIDIIDDFWGRKMSSTFKIPHYEKITTKVEKFHEKFDVLEWQIKCLDETETFLIPVGYQKAQLKKFHHKDVNVITSQHIIEHILVDYYKRFNMFVVASTFQTLEYLSRAMIAKKEGHTEEFLAYMKTATFCMGYYPERNFEELLDKKADRYYDFKKEFAHSIFFKPPVLT
ncbi:MAG: hypothetical protein ABIH00_09185 [Armatimonadota bacterium]